MSPSCTRSQRVHGLSNWWHAQPLKGKSHARRWMAPEVIEHAPYAERADVFSFAITLWELLTGRVPYEELTPLQARARAPDQAAPVA